MQRVSIPGWRIQGRTFFAVDAKGDGSLCEGCAAESDGRLCHALPDCEGDEGEPIIFKEVD